MKIIYKDGHVDECPQDQELHVIRHTAAHVMAQAIKRLYPQADFAFDPANENGFFYDVDLGDTKLSDEDLANIEKEMKKICKEKLPRLPWQQLPVIANLYATSPAEFGELAARLNEEEGVAALEVNVSCPNVKSGGILFGQDPKLAAAVTRAARDAAPNKPLIIKLSPNVTDIALMARSVQDAGADMISCINTLSGMAVDVARRKPRLANVIGGLSGPAIKPVALRCVWQVCKAVDIPVIGLGGICSAEDVLEFILVGAHAVQIGTANFISPDRAFEIVKELPAVCRQLGVTSLDELRGSLKTA